MPFRAERIGTVVATLLILLAAAAVWTMLVRTFRDAGPVESTLQAPHSLVWSGRVFADKGELTAWLSARGVDYDAWAKSHPAAAAVVDPEVAASAKAAAAKAAAAKPQQAAPKPERQASRPQRAEAGGRGGFPWALALAAAGALLAALTLLTPALLRKAAVPLRLDQPAALIARNQPQLIAASVALAIGILVAVLLN